MYRFIRKQLSFGILVIFVITALLYISTFHVHFDKNQYSQNRDIHQNSSAIFSHLTTAVSPIAVTSLDGRKTSLLKPAQAYIVPNIVHFIWFGEHNPLRFHHLLSILSAHRRLKPDKIWFHCDYEPTGQWWKYLKKNITEGLRIMKRKPPDRIFGNKIRKVEHKADVARIEILMEHGGIYLDTDVIALKSFNPLRKYEITMGIEYHGDPGRLNNGIIIANKNATFLRIWYDTYKNFSKKEWDYHDTIIPYNLQFQYPELIHVEERSLNYPSGPDKHLIYDTLYDWSTNYAIHLWYRLYDRNHTPGGIKSMETTFGEISRLVYYGSSKLLVKQKRKS